MTEIQQLKELVSAKEQRIQELMAEKKAFIRIVSHDLRSPISRIIGFADLLEKDLEENEELQEFAKLIVGGGWQLSNMIARILEVEEFETDDRELTSVEVDLSGTLNAQIEEARHLFEKKGITLNLDIPSGPLSYECDKIDLDLILSNLLSNAAKFSPKEATVEIKLEDVNGKFTLTILDQGSGFKDEEKHLIFTKFAKLSTKPTDGETTTGLGLYVVKKCVDRMGDSQVSIRNREPEGVQSQVIFA